MKHFPQDPGHPWYREPWPWLLMLGPLLVIVAGFVTAYLAIRSSDGLVDDDYYKQGLAVNQRTTRDQRAAALGVEAELLLVRDAKRIDVRLRSSAAQAMPHTLALRITHPTRPGFDQHLVLQRKEDDAQRPTLPGVTRSDRGVALYTAPLEPLQGRWHLVLEDDEQQWRLSGDWLGEQQAHHRLLPSTTGKPAAPSAE